MTRWLCRTLVAAAVATTASGCTLYFGGDDDDCLWEGAAEAAGLRNPQTNQCEFIGGGPNCGDAVPAGAAEDSFGAPAPVDWAQCFTACEGLDELSCFAAPECRATYLQTDPSAPGFRTFSGCVGIAPSGPAAPGEACQGLDGYGCSRHNDCVAIYSGEDRPDDGYSGTGVFVACEPEPITQGCYANEDCPTGFECIHARARATQIQFHRSVVLPGEFPHGAGKSLAQQVGAHHADLRGRGGDGEECEDDHDKRVRKLHLRKYRKPPKPVILNEVKNPAS